jgi:hypothetical protein
VYVVLLHTQSLSISLSTSSSTHIDYNIMELSCICNENILIFTLRAMNADFSHLFLNSFESRIVVALLLTSQQASSTENNSFHNSLAANQRQMIHFALFFCFSLFIFFYFVFNSVVYSISLQQENENENIKNLCKQFALKFMRATLILIW